MGQIGFVILTHTAPSQIAQLITALNWVYSNPPVVLHHDFDQTPANLCLPSNVRVVKPSIPTKWCTYSVVRATLAGLALLYANDVKPDWFVLLSGACYPTRRAQDVISDLEKGGYDAYLDYQLIDPFRLQTAYQYECFRRYFKWQISLPKFGRSIAFGSPLFAALSAPYRSHGYGCYAGSQWFTAKRTVAEYILASTGEYCWLGNHLRDRHCPDETYFQTILCNTDRFRISKTHYRYIDWSLEGSHPKLLDINDFPSIVSSNAHFARKLSPNSLLVSRLDEYLGVGTNAF